MILSRASKMVAAASHDSFRSTLHIFNRARLSQEDELRLIHPISRFISEFIQRKRKVYLSAEAPFITLASGDRLAIYTSHSYQIFRLNATMFAAGK